MAVQSIQCTQCRAPLRATQGAVTCEYCGAANQVGAPVPSTTMVRGVVHEVLSEDLNRNGIGDVPYHPLSLFSVIVVQMPSAMLLFRSFIITLLDKSEKIFPSLTPEDFLDNSPLMKPYST